MSFSNRNRFNPGGECSTACHTDSSMAPSTRLPTCSLFLIFGNVKYDICRLSLDSECITLRSVSDDSRGGHQDLALVGVVCNQNPTDLGPPVGRAVPRSGLIARPSKAVRTEPYESINPECDINVGPLLDNNISVSSPICVFEMPSSPRACLIRLSAMWRPLLRQNADRHQGRGRPSCPLGHRVCHKT